MSEARAATEMRVNTEHVKVGKQEVDECVRKRNRKEISLILFASATNTATPSEQYFVCDSCWLNYIFYCYHSIHAWNCCSGKCLCFPFAVHSSH